MPPLLTAHQWLPTVPTRNLRSGPPPAGTSQFGPQPSFRGVVPDTLACLLSANTSRSFLPQLYACSSLCLEQTYPSYSVPYSLSVRCPVKFHLPVLRSPSLTTSFTVAPTHALSNHPGYFAFSFSSRAFVTTSRKQTLEPDCLSSNSCSATYWLCKLGTFP